MQSHIAATAMADKSPLRRGLYGLLDDSVVCHLPLAEAAAELVEGGVAVLQLRLEKTPDREALALAKKVIAVARPKGVQVIFNDRVDLALVSGADGVHLGELDLPIADARKLLGSFALIGATTRDLAGVVRAKKDGADHVGLGPVFVTRTKTVPFAPLGPDGLRAIVRDSPLPVVAIAGIDRTNIAGVAAAGAHCAAVASALLSAADLKSEASVLSKAVVLASRSK
jgi:thiamine-phosphate pyrophosphorylase